MLSTPRLRRFALLVCLGCAPLIAHAAAVYKWVDPQGGIHFGDTAQPGWTRVDSGAAAPTPSTPAAPTDTAADRATTPARDALRAEECQRRSEQLDTYRNASQIITRDALGTERALSETERLTLIERTQQQVQTLCD